MYKKPYPLYHKEPTLLKNTTREEKILLIRVCQDCGYLETQHGPTPTSKWKHLFIHPDYFQKFDVD